MSATLRLPEDSALGRAQRAFAAHLRDPTTHSAPRDVEDRRMRIYRELVYANVESLLGSNFPVLRTVLRDEDWHALVRDFLARHDAKSPLFTQLATELLAYLESDVSPLSESVPFLSELARWEWLETELLLADEAPGPAKVDATGDLLAGVPVLSPLVRWLRATWPVHRIDADWRETPPSPQATGLVVHRDAIDAVHFMEVTPVTLRLIELLAETPTGRGRDHLERLAHERGIATPEAFFEGGLHALEDLRRRGVLLGCQRNGPRAHGERP